ncbi:MAG: GNAT family N-acetyltransferase [Euryarchaeota archaeon]|nr:GNAT family N-acetyltransferase [Euryarchaeota archaeon]
MGRYTIRRATLKDLETLVAQRRGMFHDMGDYSKRELDEADPVYRRWAASRMKRGKLVAFIAETADGAAVGGGCVWLQERQPRPGWPGGTIPYLLSMYTEPDHRRKALASRIVKGAITWCKENGYRRLTLHASKQGRGVYAGLGFVDGSEMRLEWGRKKRPRKVSKRRRKR